MSPVGAAGWMGGGGPDPLLAGKKLQSRRDEGSWVILTVM